MIFLKFLKEETKKNEKNAGFYSVSEEHATYVIQKNSTTVIEYTKCGFVNDYYR